jgi:anoctamin-1
MFFIRKFLNCIKRKRTKNGESSDEFNGTKSNTSQQWIDDYFLLDWNIMTLFNEYLEMGKSYHFYISQYLLSKRKYFLSKVIQFGFITLFVVAFPLGPLFAFFNNILEIRIDANKFLVQMKRPLAKKSLNIGVWLSILNTVSKIGVITNVSRGFVTDRLTKQYL